MECPVCSNIWWFQIFLGIVIWAGLFVHSDSRTSDQALQTFRVSLENLGVLISHWPLYVTWSFSLAAFKILYLSCTFRLLIIVYWEDFFSWLSLFTVLYVSGTFISVTLKIKNFFSIILLKIFAVLLTWVTFFFCYYSFPGFGFFIVSQNFLMFCDRIFFLFLSFIVVVIGFIFYLAGVSISSIMPSISEYISSISCIVFGRLVSEDLVWVPKFFLF